MKKKTSNPAKFRHENLAKKIDDLRGVGPGELSRYFPVIRRRALGPATAPSTDPLRAKVAEGLGLSKGRRFFQGGQ